MPHHFYLDFKKYERNTEILRALGHPMRLIIVRAIMEKGPLNLSELCKILDAQQYMVSQQLIKLERFKIITCERKRMEIYYKVENKEFILLKKILGLLK